MGFRRGRLPPRSGRGGARRRDDAGDVITVTYENDGVSLALQGKANASGGVGDAIAVLNTVSRRTIQAVVIGPGEAVVGPAADALKSARPARYAAR